MKEKRIEHKTSRTAEINCVIRGISYLEKNEELKCEDFIAPRMIPNKVKPFLGIGFLKKLFRNSLVPRGMFEYIVARTKYFDEIFQRVLRESVEQIVIFGAGFDSRGIRFLDADTSTRLFELDAPFTQEDKIKQFQKRGITVPENVKLIPIDFSKESFKTKLLEAGFAPEKKTFFIMEGLTMYLDLRDIEETWTSLLELAGEGSRILFDFVYDSVIKEEGLYYGEDDIRKRADKTGEKWVFGIERDNIDQFLEAHNFKAIEFMDSQKLTTRYMPKLRAKMNETHGIVFADCVI
ncbi:MAG: SAM-dependent methyltransferase [Spirochaetales bacterium]|nr:SAM-dependent methyltransferase [Spirochaetales bacterium]